VRHLYATVPDIHIGAFDEFSHCPYFVCGCVKSHLMRERVTEEESDLDFADERSFAIPLVMMGPIVRQTVAKNVGLNKCLVDRIKKRNISLFGIDLSRQFHEVCEPAG
jgi:hypothetical protein